MILQDRYRIKRLLAKGGMGAIYEAEAIQLGGHPIAVKETFFDENEQALRDQFQREAATLARLSHPALPRVSDHFTEGAGQFLVMQFIDGDDLSTLIQQRGRHFDVAQVIPWADTLLGALEYIHHQYPPVIHRDIKPQNIKLTPRGELFLIDFGLAKDATTPTQSGKSIHAFTLAYAPPEQIKGEGTDARSDLFSLGATLYHLLTGELPVDVKVRAEAIRYAMPDPLRPAHQLNLQVPFGLSAVLARAMALDRERRFPTAAEMRQAIRQVHIGIAPLQEKGEQQTLLEAQRLREEERRLQEIAQTQGQETLLIQGEEPSQRLLEAQRLRKRQMWKFLTLGLGVSVGIGLAPYLGNLKIPLFQALLELIPRSLQNTLLPLSAVLMGIAAIVAQWYATERVSTEWLQKRVLGLLWISLLSLILLIIVHTFVVVTIPILNGTENVSFIVGFIRPTTPPCPPEVSDAECIKRITFDPSAIDSFWGDRQVRIAKLSFIFSYLCFTTSVGLLIGLICSGLPKLDR
jgi:serine/threonine protein kinase